jgi:outer membrane murein-binding lipoprotein Lpp
MSTNLSATVAGVSSTLLSSLRGKVDKIETIFKTATAKVTQLRTDPRLSIQASTDQVRKAKEDADAAVSTVKAAAERDLAQLKVETERERDDVLRGVARAVGRPEPSNATEALLGEQREARAWGRIKPQLDLEPAQYGPIMLKVKGLALGFIAGGDEDSLAALRADLGPYLSGRGLPSSASGDGLRQLDELIGGERPAVAAALALQCEVEKGAYSVLLGVNYATHAIRSGAQLVTLVEWDGKTARSVTMQGVTPLNFGNLNTTMGRQQS